MLVAPRDPLHTLHSIATCISWQQYLLHDPLVGLSHVSCLRYVCVWWWGGTQRGSVTWPLNYLTNDVRMSSLFVKNSRSSSFLHSAPWQTISHTNGQSALCLERCLLVFLLWTCTLWPVIFSSTQVCPRISDVRIPKFWVRVSPRILTQDLRQRSQQQRKIGSAVSPPPHWQGEGLRAFSGPALRCTKCGQLFLKKIIKVVATKCHI